MVGVAIFGYLLILMLLYIPSLQRQVTSLITDAAEELLDTEVYIGEVRFGLFNRVILNDVYIKDHNDSTLLKASRFSAKFEPSSIIQGVIAFSSIQLYSFDICLYQHQEETAHNYQFLIDRFAGNGKGGIPNLRINSLLIRHGKITYDRTYMPHTPGVFNTNHLSVNDLNATLSLKAFSSDSINLRVKKFNMKEHSGFCLKQVSFRLVANDEHAILSDFNAEFPHSIIQLSPIEASYSYLLNTEEGVRKMTHLSYGGELKNTTIHLADLAPFLPITNLQNTPLAFHADSEFKGWKDRINIPSLHIYTGNKSIEIQIPTSIEHILDAKLRKISTHISPISIDSLGLKELSTLLPENRNDLRQLVHALGSVNAKGKVNSTSQDHQVQLSLNTPNGFIETNAKLQQGVLSYRLHSPFFDWSPFMGDKTGLGTSVFDIEGEGQIHTGTLDSARLHADIQHIEYKEYPYQDVMLDVRKHDKRYNGSVTLKDPNAQMQLSASAIISNQWGSLTINGEIDSIRPNTIHISEVYPDMTFMGKMQLQLQGSCLDDFTGQLKLKDLTVSEPNERTYVENFSIKTITDGTLRNVTIDSDFLTADLSGRFNFSQLAQEGIRLLSGSVPSLFPHNIPARENTSASLSIDLRNVKMLSKFTSLPIHMHEPAQITGYLNSKGKEVFLKAQIPSFQYKDQELRKIEVSIGSQNGAFYTDARMNKSFGNSPTDLRFKLDAVHDSVYASLNWENFPRGNYQGKLETLTRFGRTYSDSLRTTMEIRKTQMTINDTIWTMHPSTISISPSRIEVDDFKLNQSQRHLLLDGTISNDENDSLIVDLDGINLGYIFRMIAFNVVNFDGEASGKIYAKDLLSQPYLDADLLVKQFTFNKALLGDMRVYGGWNPDQNAIALDAHMSDTTQNSTTHVNGNIQLGKAPKGGLDLSINTTNIDVSFLNKYTEGIFTGLRGRASGYARVFGPFKSINLEGDLLVNRAELKVNAINVDYHVVNDSVTLRPDIITFKNATVYDPYGDPGTKDHYAKVSGQLTHNSFKNLHYNFDIDGYNILGYDEKDFGDNFFCGTAYATGNIKFNGAPGHLAIDIKARPEANTLFTYNLSTPSTITSNKFITFENHDSPVLEKIESKPTEQNTSSPEMDIHMNFELDITPAATMKILMDPIAGDYIGLNGNGNIRAQYYNKGAFTMHGLYTVDHGIYKLSLQDVIRKDFQLTPGGTISFSGLPFKGDLNLQAVYTVPSVSLNDLSSQSTFSQNNVRVNCLMNLTGKAESPQISFDFDIPNVNEDEKQMVRSLISTEEERNMQVIYLLGIGRFYTYDYTNSEQSQSSVAMKSLLSSTISGQLNQMFSNILGNNSNWNIGTNLSTGQVGWSDMDVEGLLSGRLLNNRLLINGNFGYRESAATMNSNFVGDFDIQWLLTKNGNISLKAYSKTNDRYFTKSTLTTQGVGIGMKRDFNSWREIFRLFIPKRKRNKDVESEMH